MITSRKTIFNEDGSVEYMWIYNEFEEAQNHYAKIKVEGVDKKRLIENKGIKEQKGTQEYIVQVYRKIGDATASQEVPALPISYLDLIQN